MEIKGVTENFSDRSSIMPWTPAGIQYTMDKIEAIFEECDIELTEAEMPPLGYEKQPISIMIEHMVILIRYVSSAHSQCYSELDHPLYVGFKNGATEILSNIILEDITTDNTFEMQRYVEVYDVNGHYYRSKLKKELTMADFLGLDAVVPEDGMPVIENVETIGWFADLFRADYENMGAAVESLDQMLEIYLYSGEYSHKEYHPIGNLISGILDVTIIKPFIESIYGHDLITGEQLTDFERGMQLVNAVVGAVTFGQGALALNFAEMGGKEIAVGLLKIWAVDALSDMSAYTVGYACDALGMPAGVTFLASLATGCTVSVKAGGYVFTDSSGKVVKELDADGMQAFLKELDVDLDDVTWGGEYKGGSGALKFNNWDDMKDAYKGTITQFVKENKPKYSPDIKKWFDNGGSIEIQNIDGKQIWTYTSSVGDSVPYIDGYIKFPDEYLNPTIKTVDIGEFTGDRSEDIDKMLDILEEDYGITEIPEGYIVHHDIENGIVQLVDENIHKKFTHIGGHSIYK